MITLRGHHLLCLRTFAGRGYDSRFVANMQHIVGRLAADPELEVRVVVSGDAICRCCPFHAEDGCRSGGGPAEARVSRKDRLVLDLLGLAPETVLPFSQVREKVERLLHRDPELASVCGGCEWWDICLQRVNGG